MCHSIAGIVYKGFWNVVNYQHFILKHCSGFLSMETNLVEIFEGKLHNAEGARPYSVTPMVV